MSVDPHFERSVLAEFALRERRVLHSRRRRDRSHRARELAERLHRGSHDLLAHLMRVAFSVPERFRPVAWLHHATDADVTTRELAAAGLTSDEVIAVELLAGGHAASPESSALAHARALSKVPGTPGRLARVVARAVLQDRLGNQQADGELVAALVLLPDPELER